MHPKCYQLLAALPLSPYFDVVHIFSYFPPRSEHEFYFYDMSEYRQSFMRMAKEAHDMIHLFKHVEDLILQSACKSVYLSFLIGRCPRVKRLEIGPNTQIGDEVLFKIYAQHGLAHLEEFHCEKSSPAAGGAGVLTLVTLTLLLNNCPNLRAVSDIQNWSGVPANEVGIFRQHCHDNNLELDTRSHVKLRRYLEMQDFERKTYVNMLAGPTMERMRMARENNNNNNNNNNDDDDNHPEA